ncbi:MAG: hypothetical protein IH612_10235 [Desulfofustis sp.]|nr:hypothetical protein [Desulfofustis sp.]
MNLMIKNRIIVLALATLLSGGCHLESGQRLLAELGLDSQSLSTLPPAERTLACIAETDGNTLASFRDEYTTSLTAFQRDPVNGDWSGLVCLALSNQAEAEQIRQTIETLDVAIAARREGRYDPLFGFYTILKQRYNALAWHGEENRYWQAQLAAQQAHFQLLNGNLEERLAAAERLAAEKQEQVHTLEQQVRKLKEVELMLQPQSNEPR